MPWPEGDSSVAWPFSDDEYDPEIGEELYQTYLEQLALCEELGYDMVALNEHHYSSYGLMPSPNLMASNLVARTDEIPVGIMGNVLPIRGQPIRVAEELAMLDVLSGGRIVSGFVRGIPSEYAAYNVDPDESRDRFAEAWELIVRAWEEEDQFDWNGDFFQYNNVYIWPRPKQDPHPPLWMPAESEKSIQFAVEKRVPIGRVYAGTENVASTFDRYRELAREIHDWTPSDEYFTPCRLVYVAETMERARAEAEEHLDFFYRYLFGALYKSGAVKAVGDSEYREENAFEYEEKAPDLGQKAMNFDFDEFQESGEIIVGDPDYVAAEIERQYDAMGGFGTLISLFHFGTLPDGLTRKSLRLFAEEVKPAIDDLGDAGTVLEPR